jgi:hypothetical protein
MIDVLERTRREQAALCHDQSPFVRILARAEEIERRWPVQGDPGDERSDDAAQAHVEGRLPVRPFFDKAKWDAAWAEPLDQAKLGPGVLCFLCGPFGRPLVILEGDYAVDGEVVRAPTHAELVASRFRL